MLFLYFTGQRRNPYSGAHEPYSAEPRSKTLTGQLADKPTRGQSSRGLDNSRTGQLADSEFLKIMELLYFICRLILTLTLTLSNIGSV